MTWFADLSICTYFGEPHASSASTQLHDFSPGNGEHDGIDAAANALYGDLFWTVRLDEGQFRLSEDGATATLDVKDLLEFDRILFLGNANIPTRLSFHIEYTRESGRPTLIKPIPNPAGYDSHQWSGAMWNAKASGWFTASYLDGSESWSGTIDSAGAPGQAPNGIALPYPSCLFSSRAAARERRHQAARDALC